jgi:murein L,D-transpeptidase YcbB/YkuD
MGKRLTLACILLAVVWVWGVEESRATSVSPVEKGQEYTQSGDVRLQQALEWYRQLAEAGGWPVLPNGPTLRPGDRSERVVALRMRLQVSGDMPSPGSRQSSQYNTLPDADDTLFDDELEQAVRIFQSRHGLQVDGIVGPMTLAALQVPVEARIAQMVLNLERWHRNGQAFEDRYILVNIPAFTLDVVEYEHAVMRMRVIVGKPYQRTPTFHETMTYLVLNPYWEVPHNIAKREILPELHNDPTYLQKHNMKVIASWGPSVQVVDPATINWSVISSHDLRYRFRQEPGIQNALGQIKFKFPNAFNVYLHDTSTPSLFAKPQRAFSHGCIRVEKPIDLAVYLLQDMPQWSRQQILATIAGNVQQRIDLRTPITVHIVYRTAWVDEDGSVQFRPDIYRYDKEQEATFCATIAGSCG